MSDKTTLSAGQRIRAVKEADTDDFLRLVELSGLDPTHDFRHMDLRGFDFSNCDLSGFDFTGSLLDGANFDGALTHETIFDPEPNSFTGVTYHVPPSDAELIKACISGDAELAYQALDTGANPNCEIEGRTPLIEASANNHSSIIEILISRGAQVDRPTSERQWTAMLEAASKGQTDAIRQLVSGGAEINLTSRASTPLCEAAQNGRLEAVEQLLDRGAQIDLKGRGNTTALLAASLNGHGAVAEALIRRGASLKPKTKGKKTLLHVTVDSGNEKLVRLILDRGGTANKTGKVGVGILAAAIKAGDVSILNLLLDRGVVVDAARATASIENDASVSHVCQTGNLPILRTLIDRGFTVGPNALVVASESNQIETVRFLLSLTRRSHRFVRVLHNNREALFAAAVAGNIDVIKILLSHSNCLESTVKRTMGQTLLMHVCRVASPSVMSVLLDGFVTRINRTDEKGHTALDYAILAENNAIIPLLRQAGALAGRQLNRR